MDCSTKNREECFFSHKNSKVEERIEKKKFIGMGKEK